MQSRFVVTCLSAGAMVLALGACNFGSSGSGANDRVELPGTSKARTRYGFNNQCFALRSNGNGRFVARDGGGYSATADLAGAERFFLKPSALGSYLFYNTDRQLLAAGGGTAGNVGLPAANASAEWTLLGVGDVTEYPETPPLDREPDPDYLDDYRGFEDPEKKYRHFTIGSEATGDRLAVNEAGQLVTVAPDSAGDAESFSLVTASGCETFPEAQDNTEGETFKGTRPDGTVLGMADVHVHISATTFLGDAQWGWPFHRFGVTHALGDCEALHGPNGILDAVGAFLGNDFDGHSTTGWPTFPDWPARDALTHEAIYWKWLERSWKAGLRIAVNDLVDNETLCELQRNLSAPSTGDPLQDCNSMNNAARQVGTMYAMQDYIDAQHGGRGEGWFRIVLDPQEARRVVEDGKLAVVLGVEISNLFDCKLTYNPLRTQEPFEETGTGINENSYGCTMEEGQPNSILTQLQRLHDLGVRQVITIHEFDNAFGGNGIFDSLVLNVGNRENTGGIPSGDIAAILDQIENPNLTTLLSNLETTETPTGEFWTTYDCPVEGEDGFSGYLWDDAGGVQMQGIPALGDTYAGQGGRPGGTVPIYPEANQCNARWLTPIGQYTYTKLMEHGMIFDIDHLELEIKTQALELAEAQEPAYPFVSTHGTFGGITEDQATRILRNGGLLYPDLNGNGRTFIEDMEELLTLHREGDVPHRFGFGFGTDTNGLSAQARPRGDLGPDEAIVYPYTLFDGPVFDELPEFNRIDGVTFHQPRTEDPDGRGRTWHLDIDGSAHHGMISGFVEEVRKEGTPEQMRHLFNSAEVYLQTWERTVAASEAINDKGIVIPGGILRRAPTP